MKSLSEILERVLDADINIDAIPDPVIQYLVNKNIGWEANGEEIINWYKKKYSWWREYMGEQAIATPGPFIQTEFKLSARDSAEKFWHNCTQVITKNLCLIAIKGFSIWGIAKKKPGTQTYTLKAMLRSDFDKSDRGRKFGLESLEQDGCKVIDIKSSEDIDKVLKSIR